jgi:type VI secretion system ImpC/EvpB family protein/type VI secretion system ImpB/VipA family protein
MKFNTGDELGGGAGGEGPILPLRVLLVADLVPRDEHNAGASAPEAAIRIDPARFEELFTKLRPRIAVEVPSVLAEGRPVRVDLAPTSLKSFRPDGLCAELPLLRSLLDGRLVLDRLRDGSVTQDQARSELDRLWGGSPFAREVLGLLPSSGGAGGAARTGGGQAAPAPTPVQAPETNVDALLAMVDLPGPSAVSSEPSFARPRDEAPIPATPAAQSKFGDLIAQVARSGKSSAGGIRPVEAIARVERALGAQIGAILQHPEVRRLEQAWRGLRLLTERAQGHSGIRVDIVSARPENAAEAFDRAARTAGDPPICCAIVDVVIDGTATSFARLEAIAKIAEKHTIPAVLNGSSKLLGLDDLQGVDRLDNKGSLFDAPHKAPWRSAVSKPETRWVSIAINGALARGPYDKTSSRVREAVIKEIPDDDGGFVWIPPAYLVGSLIVKSFRDTGWPHRIVSGKGGLIEDLQVREIKSGYEGEEGIAIPTEAFISTDSQRDLAKLGVLAIASAPNSDAAIVMNAPTAYVTPPKRTYDSASTEPELRLDRVSLIDQLFVARVVQFLHALCSKIPPSSDPAEVQPVVDAALWTLFENAPPGGLEINVNASNDGHGTSVAVTVRPRRFLGVQIEEVSLEMPLG